jgi:hypothetical protein
MTEGEVTNVMWAIEAMEIDWWKPSKAILNHLYQLHKLRDEEIRGGLVSQAIRTESWEVIKKLENL